MFFFQNHLELFIWPWFFFLFVCLLIIAEKFSYTVIIIQFLGYSSSGVGAGAASGTFNSAGTYGSNFPYNGFQGKNAGAGSGFGFAPQPFFQPIPFPQNYNDFVANFFKNFQNQQFG